MTTPRHHLEYLRDKRAARAEIEARVRSGELVTTTVRATVTAEGRSGLRRIRIRDHQLLSDSAVDFAGYDLGPTSPELQIGTLGSCLVHTFLIHAAVQQIPLHAIEVEVSADLDARAGVAGFEDIAPQPGNIRYAVRISSPAPRQRLLDLHRHVERTCPVLNLVRLPNDVHASLVIDDPAVLG
ncbi:OsmC family protein [Nocardia sp. NPDC059239]|uniref:OsmC family protein n=1 Tax=Nocardia sp. NPDC059239 TaxID=3346785 RepID=UPI0036976E0D